MVNICLILNKSNTYNKLLVNIIAHLSVLSRMIEKEIKDLNRIESHIYYLDLLIY